jgi:hypothetical protein
VGIFVLCIFCFTRQGCFSSGMVLTTASDGRYLLEVGSRSSGLVFFSGRSPPTLTVLVVVASTKECFFRRRWCEGLDLEVGVFWW